MKKLEKNIEYANQIVRAIQNLFNSDEEQMPAFIDLAELEKGDNATEFFIGYLKAGTLMFNQMIKGDKNNLEFTHILNQLCVQDLLKDRPEKVNKVIKMPKG